MIYKSHPNGVVTGHNGDELEKIPYEIHERFVFHGIHVRCTSWGVDLSSGAASKGEKCWYELNNLDKTNKDHRKLFLNATRGIRELCEEIGMNKKYPNKRKFEIKNIHVNLDVKVIKDKFGNIEIYE